MPVHDEARADVAKTEVEPGRLPRIPIRSGADTEVPAVDLPGGAPPVELDAAVAVVEVGDVPLQPEEQVLLCDRVPVQIQGASWPG